MMRVQNSEQPSRAREPDSELQAIILKPFLSFSILKQVF